MGLEKKPPEPEDTPGAPEWMLTFSDCMTLLLTFFVLLISFSAPGSSDIKGLSNAIAEVLPGFNWANEMYRDSLTKHTPLYPAEGVEAGSEKPTLENGTKGGLKETTTPFDLDIAKVFLIPSENIFLGKGPVISPKGRDILTTMASFLKKIPNRVVICEYRPKGDKDSENTGLERGWAVMEYLATQHNLDKSRLAISSSPTSITTEENFESSAPSQSMMEPERILEIVVLDRSSYN